MFSHGDDMDVVRFCFALTACALFLTACEIPSGTSESKVEKVVESCEATAVPDRYIVRWKDGSYTRENADSREALIRDVIKPNDEQIEFAENDQLIRIEKPVVVQSSASYDPAPANWGQERTGAVDAWAKGIAGEGIIVAVVDSGVDVNHPQLSAQMAVNSAEVINGIDDDKNGYIDDVIGWDFSSGSPYVNDGSGHGTHVAGIVAADHTKGTVKGVAPKAKILPLDFMGDDGYGTIGGGIEAMYYAAKRGAKVVNASWGGSRCSRALRTAIENLSKQGVLFISASGNGDEYGRGENLDLIPTYPAAFAVGLQISVGASSFTDTMEGFSNYSRKLVHLLAPGSDIFSTYPENSTRYQQGTSMATPFVAGAAALVWSHRPRATADQVREALLSSVDYGNFPVVTGGRLNITRAIEKIEALVPDEAP